uniref:Immunoglobulin V-set domain-containing protein n=1 Tax=Cyprinus carpio TaxID=7962 RepID=A0A8C1TUG5_CYPCA
QNLFISYNLLLLCHLIVNLMIIHYIHLTTVTLLCSNILKEPSYIAWFKQTNDSLPLCIATQYVSEKPVDSIYFNGFKENHLEMSVDKTFSSLKTVNVDVSDSGIFYCGYVLTNHMMFHDKTQLVVVNGNILRFHLMFISFIYSSIIYIQNKQKEGQSTSIVCLHFLYCQEQDADLNYAALSLDKKKNRRPVRRLKEVEPNVVYAATR